MIVVARHHREWQLPIKDFVGHFYRWNLDVENILRRCGDEPFNEGVGHCFVTTGGMFVIDVLADWVLPHVSKTGCERDAAAVLHRISGDVLHHVPEHLAGIERETQLALMTVV